MPTRQDENNLTLTVLAFLKEKKFIKAAAELEKEIRVLNQELHLLLNSIGSFSIEQLKLLYKAVHKLNDIEKAL